MKKKCEYRSRVRDLLFLLLCVVFTLSMMGCGSEETEKALTEEPGTDPLETITQSLTRIDAENMRYGTISRIKKSGSEYNADLRVYEWQDTDEEPALTDQEEYEKITLTKNTTIVYATNSKPNGVVMNAEEFQANFVEGDYNIFAVYFNEDGKVALLYTYNIVAGDE